ncbi:MAG: hypothetical protein PHI32_00110 [Dysgonamonadaceae bacterium]|nr:hypothetical protein [Dysgonamonadaceae bacterium]MDD4727653.1 hypothetical protein [Dysgonamonadaceae bacterium]
MEKMHISFIIDLRNIEFLALVQLLVMVLDSNNIYNINLKEATERIKKQKKELLLLRNTKLSVYSFHKDFFDIELSIH